VLDDRALFGILDEQDLLDGYIHTVALRTLADYELLAPEDLAPRHALDCLAIYVSDPSEINAYTAHLASYAVAPSVGRANARRKLTHEVIDIATHLAAETAQRAALVPYASDRVWAAILTTESAAAAIQYFTWFTVGESAADDAHRAETAWQQTTAIGLAYPELKGAPAEIAIALADEFNWPFAELITITANICL
jgi:hypothetical protein